MAVRHFIEPNSFSRNEQLALLAADKGQKDGLAVGYVPLQH